MATPTTKVFTFNEDLKAMPNVNALPQPSFKFQLVDAEGGFDSDIFPITVPDLTEGQCLTPTSTADSPEGSAAPKPIVLSGVPCVIM